jgi:ferric-dicitrate binding protein FerR (iron transport regulator)
VRRDPEGFGGYRRLGLLYQARFDKTRNPNDAREAAAWMGRAAERYPQHAEMQAELAELQAAADEHAAAREAAQRALDLDALNQQAGHRDKYLTPALRARLAGLLEPPPDASRARPP